MKDCDYSPYLNQNDAIEEYKSLRSEILESQKQRIQLFHYSLILYSALFAYLIKDGFLQPPEALFLVCISIGPSLFSFATRYRERRIAGYLSSFLKPLSPWSTLSSKKTGDLQLGFFQRTSTTIIFFMIILDFIVLTIGFPKHCSLRDVIYWFFGIVLTAINIFIACKAKSLKNYKKDFENELQEYVKCIS